MVKVLTTLAMMAGGTSNICTTQNCVVYSDTATTLYQVDPATLVQTELCRFQDLPGAGVSSTSVNDIAVDDNGILYAVTGDALYEVDPTSCETTLLASVAQVSSDFNGLSCLIGGQIVAADAYGNVVELDSSTGNVTTVGSYGNSYGCSGDIVATSDGTIYSTAVTSPPDPSTDLLVTLDPSNNYAASVIGEIGYVGVFGLGYWAGVLYGFDQAGNVLTIDPSTGIGTVAVANAGIVWHGGATTPEAPTCTNTCTPPGSTVCDGNGNLDSCDLQSNGCYAYDIYSCGTGSTCSGGACVGTCTNACNNGDTQCDPSGNGNLDTCVVGSNGCTNWSSQACPSGQACSNNVCANTCTSTCVPFTSTCDANGDLDTCTQQSNGCWAYDISPCGTNMVCSSGACGSSCTDECTSGTTQCDANGNLDTCTQQSNGCLGWSAAPCSGGLTCSGGTCVTACSNRCTAGSTQCDPSSGNLDNCTMQSNGCYDWIGSPCSSPLVCTGGACVPNCTNACFPLTTQCDSMGNLQTCSLQSNLCFNWTTNACPTGQSCVGGSCALTCSNRCSAGQAQCSGSTVQTCNLQPSGCYDWVDGPTCSGSELCTAGVCATSCSDPCTSGQTQCDGTFTQTCATDPSGCTEWQNATDCGPYTCAGAGCCACNAGQAQCTSNGEVETCTASGNRNICPTWVTAACASGSTCFQGTCLVSCELGAELDTCPNNEKCVAVADGDYCVTPTADGGFVAPSTSSSGTGGTAGTNAGTNASTGGVGSNGGIGNAGSNGGASGTTGLTGAGAAGSTGHATEAAGSSGGIGGTVGAGASSGTTGKVGASSGTTSKAGNGHVATTGCGCGSTEGSDLAGLLIGLAALRRRRV